MSESIDVLERQRVALQAELDAQKTRTERNRLGQFATPAALACDILKYAATLLPPDENVHFLDPAIGTGSFYSALCMVFPGTRLAEALGFEIDPQYAAAASTWKGSGLLVKVADFTHAKPFARFNMVICNPTYVRHHHLENDEKSRLQFHTQQASGMKINGLAGLYCHFLGLAHAWMTDGGVAGWLIPSEFMDVNYGLAVKRYLLDRVTLLHIHRFDPNDVQFADALVSSAVVWFRKESPPQDHAVTFSFGGTLFEPKLSRSVPLDDLDHEPKWTRFPAAHVTSRSDVPTISDFFQIKRGLATGHNGFFILSEEEIASRGLPMAVLKPILPSPRYVPEDEIMTDREGAPKIDHRCFLLDTRLAEDEIKRRYPALHRYLEEGKTNGLHKRYLCQHRSPWYSQEVRPPAPIVCTYLGRGDVKSGRPFRFILNHSRATVANVYLAMYPRPILAHAMARDPDLIRRIWKALNAITPERLLREGRVYGGGLHKLEPNELAHVPVPEIAVLLPHDLRPPKQGELLAQIGA
jgi:adenine-specific DNA-methyltransferase